MVAEVHKVHAELAAQRAELAQLRAAVEQMRDSEAQRRQEAEIQRQKAEQQRALDASKPLQTAGTVTPPSPPSQAFEVRSNTPDAPPKKPVLPGPAAKPIGTSPPPADPFSTRN